eukprot:TRINITY_DN93153_c0_g1_i1.p1 TRINITY_DN93153_c0_g1~~TRINITY_DN93153_c0_g1_i1.p1  ORF type:complete len:319 (-),score=82.48 TRINITY_DN93153_c0_g1_i1:185-1141(-)
MSSPQASATKKAVLVAAVAAAGVAVTSLYFHYLRRRQRLSSNRKRPQSLADEIREALAKEAVDSGSAEEEFNLATEWVSQYGAGLSNQAKLRLYGCYKQATAGDCTTSQPWGMEASYKWEAWNSQQGLSKVEAMCAYVANLSQVASNWRFQQGLSEEEMQNNEEEGGPNLGGGMGPSVSTMGRIGEDSGDVDETPIGKLCEKIADGEVEEVLALLKRCPELTFQADKEQMTPLHWACDRGEAEIVKVLLDKLGQGQEAKARIDAQDETGETPLHYAVNTENEEIAQMLVASGADISIANEAGETPESLAADAGLALKP